MKYYVNNIYKLPNNLSRFHASSKTDEKGEVLGFFGELNPLSNFHPATFTVNEKQYISSEQFIQETKALLFKDIETANKIMLSETSLEGKESG